MRPPTDREREVLMALAAGETLAYVRDTHGAWWTVAGGRVTLDLVLRMSKTGWLSLHNAYLAERAELTRAGRDLADLLRARSRAYHASRKGATCG